MSFDSINKSGIQFVDTVKFILSIFDYSSTKLNLKLFEQWHQLSILSKKAWAGDPKRAMIARKIARFKTEKFYS